MTDHEIAETMQSYGGSFVQALGRTFFVADAVNRERLREAFPDLFTEYARLAQVRLDREKAAVIAHPGDALKGLE